MEKPKLTDKEKIKVQNHIQRIYQQIGREELKHPDFPMSIGIYGSTKSWQNFEPKGYIILFFNEKGAVLCRSMGVISIGQAMRSLLEIYRFNKP